MSIYDNGCMNCSVCGKFCSIEKAGIVEQEQSDLDGVMCTVAVTCKGCAAKQASELEKHLTTNKGCNGVQGYGL